MINLKQNVKRTKHPYIKPIMSLFDNIQIKASIAVFFQFLSEWGLQDIYITLTESPLKLIIVVVLLVFVDFVSGVFKAWKSNVPISSAKMRQTVIKSIEYIFFLGAIILFANAFAEESDIIGYIAEKLKVFAFFLVSIIELNSIFENLGNTELNNAWQKLKDKFNIKVEEDEK